MPGLIAFLTAVLALVATVGGVAGGASFAYGAFHWMGGDHQRGKSHLVHSVIGIGILLCAGAMGTALAALPHA